MAVEFRGIAHAQEVRGAAHPLAQSGSAGRWRRRDDQSRQQPFNFFLSRNNVVNRPAHHARQEQRQNRRRVEYSGAAAHPGRDLLHQSQAIVQTSGATANGPGPYGCNMCTCLAWSTMVPAGILTPLTVVALRSKMGRPLINSEVFVLRFPSPAMPT